MKRVSHIVASSVMSVLMLGGIASATGSDSIINTGPGSNNTVTIDNSCTSTITNNNDVNISNSSQQSSVSGRATSTGNTSAGNVSSGRASNSNSFGVDLTINNPPYKTCDPQTATATTSNGQVSSVSTTATSNGQVNGVSTTATVKASTTQVQAPVGGVGAGEGGISSSIFAASVVSGAFGIHRLRKSNLQKV